MNTLDTRKNEQLIHIIFGQIEIAKLANWKTVFNCVKITFTIRSVIDCGLTVKSLNRLNSEL